MAVQQERRQSIDGMSRFPQTENAVQASENLGGVLDSANHNYQVLLQAVVRSGANFQPDGEEFIGVIIGRPDKTRLASHPAYIGTHQHFCTVFNNFSKF